MLLFVLTATLVIAPAVDAAALDSAPEFESSWILVKLNERLGTKTSDATYELNTRHPTLNRVIAGEGILSIDDALPVSIRAPRNPRALARHGLDRIYRFHVPDGTDLHALIDRFSSLPEVDYAEPDYIANVAGAVPPVKRKRNVNAASVSSTRPLSSESVASRHGGVVAPVKRKRNVPMPSVRSSWPSLLE